MTRRLAYPDRKTNYLVSEINTEDTRTIEEELALTEESQFLILEVTGEQWRRLFDAIMTGADLHFDEESHDVMWPYWRTATVGSLCDAVQACMASGGGGGTGGNPQAPVAKALRDNDMLPDDYECDEDHAFGLARAIVEAINDATTEIFEQIELATNALELANEVADNVPIVSLAATAGDFIAWVQNTIKEIYDAAWSDTTRDEIACDLRCKILEDCTLSFDDVFALYAEGFAGLPEWDKADFLTWLDWLFQLTPATNENTVKVGGMMGLIAMRFGGKFLDVFELGIYSFATVVKLNADEESDEWSVVCDSCPDLPWKMRADFTQTGLPAFFTINNGVKSALGIAAVYNPTPNKTNVAYNMETGSEYNALGFETFYTELNNKTGSSGDQIIFQGLVVPDTFELFETVDFGVVSEGSGSYESVLDVDIDSVFSHGFNASSSGAGGGVRLVALEVSGIGVNPFTGQTHWTAIE